MEISRNRAFLLGSGFGLKVEGSKSSNRIVSLVLSLILTVATGGIFFVAGPLIGRIIHNRNSREKNSVEKTTDETAARIFENRISDFDFSQLIPDNIEQFLEVKGKHLFSTYPKLQGEVVIRETKGAKEKGIKEKGYLFFLATGGTSATAIPIFITENNRFQLPRMIGLKERPTFDNFQEVLDFICKKEEYKGAQPFLKLQNGQYALFIPRGKSH